MNFAPLLKAAPFSGARVKPFQGVKKYLSTGDLQEDGISLVDISFDSKPSRADIVVSTGDVLFARMKGTKKVLRISPDLDGIIVSTGFAVVRPNENCSADYLVSYLRSEYFEREKARLCSGAIQPAITNEGIQDLSIPCPVINDQIRIAHLLGKVEGLIAQRKQHLQQLDDLLKSVFLEMFGDPVRNEKGWDKPPLHAFGKISTGNTPPRNDPTNYASAHIEWIKTDNIAADAVFVTKAAEHLSEAGAKRARTVEAGALLVACIAGSVESIGRAALTDRKVAFNQQINAIQPGPEVDSTFLYALFKLGRSYIQSHASKGMKKILTKGDFEQIRMIRPPFDLQREFAAVAGQIDTLAGRYRESLTDHEILYAALSQSAFNGDLDLSRIPLPAAIPEPVPMEDSTNVAVELEVPAFPLPDPKLPIEALSNEAGRLQLLTTWLEAWNAAHPAHAFVLPDFLDAAQTRLAELYPEDDLELGMAAYEQIKNWVFAALDSGALAQDYDEEAKRITLKAAHA